MIFTLIIGIIILIGQALTQNTPQHRYRVMFFHMVSVAIIETLIILYQPLTFMEQPEHGFVAWMEPNWGRDLALWAGFPLTINNARIYIYIHEMHVIQIGIGNQIIIQIQSPFISPIGGSYVFFTLVRVKAFPLLFTFNLSPLFLCLLVDYQLRIFLRKLKLRNKFLKIENNQRI